MAKKRLKPWQKMRLAEAFRNLMSASGCISRTGTLTRGTEITHPREMKYDDFVDLAERFLGFIEKNFGAAPRVTLKTSRASKYGPAHGYLTVYDISM